MTDRYYSQHGEDIVAWKVLANSNGPHYFVEVGMIDGKRFSNTLALEERGWRGLCVEAHPHYVGMVRSNRPNSVVIHAAASDQNAILPFYADPRGDLSSLVARDEVEMKRRFGHWFQGYEVVKVPARTLDDMLKQAQAPCGMEMVSIDIEGAELAALRGMDLSYWKPRILMVEADDDAACQALDAYLRPQGYTRARIIGVNAVYTRHWRDAWRIRVARVDARVFHTAHPVDRSIDDGVCFPIAYETRRQYAKRMFRSFAKAA